MLLFTIIVKMKNNYSGSSFGSLLYYGLGSSFGSGFIPALVLIMMLIKTTN